MPKKTPLTFAQAMRKAESYVGHKVKLLWLVKKATRKAEQHYESLLAPWESFQILVRLIRFWLAGKYCAPAGSILMAVAAVIYFVSPFDLIPTPFQCSALSMTPRSSLSSRGHIGQ